MADDFKISPQYRASQWWELRPSLAAENGEAWSKAIDILRDRLESRFFQPIVLLRDAQDSAELGFGFSMLVLDCLLIDTIESFREGRTKGSEVRTARAFINFLSRSEFFKEDFTSNELIRKFFDAVRCGLIHDGEARKGWRVWKDHPVRIVEKSGKVYMLYRDHFHRAIVSEFDSYLRGLRSDCLSSLRENFLRRMDAICELPASVSDDIRYFAYGSNMDRDQMLSRVPSAKFEGVAHLSEYQLVFNKRGKDGTAKANIQSSVEEGAYVLGALYRVSKSEFECLCSIERGYSPTTVQVDQDGAGVTACTFIADTKSLYRGSPNRNYFHVILKGAAGLNLSSEYQMLIKEAGDFDQEDGQKPVGHLRDGSRQGPKARETAEQS